MDSLSSVDRAIDVLFQLRAEPGARGVSELGRSLGLPKSTTHRLLASLARRGLLERDARGRYRLGTALVGLGLGALEQEPVVAIARPVLVEEAASLGETVFLTAVRGGAIVVLDKAEGAGFLRASPRVGERIPVHATAVGKLVLAHAPALIEPARGPLEPFTAQTARSALTLDAEVARARLRGYAENHGEWIEGLSVVAAPVLLPGHAAREASRDAAGFAGALAAAAPTARMEGLGVERVARRLIAAAHRVAAALSNPPVRRSARQAQEGRA